MVKSNTRIFLSAILLAILPATSYAQVTAPATGSAANTAAGPAATILSNAAKAMGAESLRTLQYSGAGSSYAVGQNVNPDTGWPHSVVKSYARDLNFETGASRAQIVRLQGNPPAEQTQTQVSAADSPWSVQFDYWITPYAFLKAAMANHATAETKNVYGSLYKVVTFTLQNKHKLVGYFTEADMLDKVETWVDSPVLGDMLVEAYYRDYTDFNGLKFPTTIMQKQGGLLSLILIVKDVKPNSSVNIAAPAAQTAMPGVRAERVADGVVYLTGGSHHSVAVEFGDHIAVVEAPQNEERSQAVMAEVKRQIPGKPIRYVINTHHHWDHSGGLRAYADAWRNDRHASNQQIVLRESL